MRTLKKTQQKRTLLIIGSAVFALTFGGFACHRGSPATTSIGGGSDAKMAAERIAEADQLWEGREDLTKARVAVASLRQAQTADYAQIQTIFKNVETSAR